MYSDMGKDDGVKRYHKFFRYEDNKIMIVMSKKSGLSITLKKDGIGEMKVVFEPFIDTKFDDEILWLHDGCWVDVVENFVFQMEKEMNALANKINKSMRLPIILT